MQVLHLLASANHRHQPNASDNHTAPFGAALPLQVQNNRCVYVSDVVVVVITVVVVLVIVLLLQNRDSTQFLTVLCLLWHCHCGAAAHAGHDCQQRHRTIRSIQNLLDTSASTAEAFAASRISCSGTAACKTAFVARRHLFGRVGCLRLRTASTYAALALPTAASPVRQRNAIRADRWCTSPPPLPPPVLRRQTQ